MKIMTSDGFEAALKEREVAVQEDDLDGDFTEAERCFLEMLPEVDPLLVTIW